MTSTPIAIVYCEGALQTTNGKTAHGLVRRCERYDIVSVVDSHCAGKAVSQIVRGGKTHIIVEPSIELAIDAAKTAGTPASVLIIGLAPDGGRLPQKARQDVATAIDSGLDVVSGLHDFLSDDPSLSKLAEARGVSLIDVRKPPDIKELHFFTGNIDKVQSFRVAVLGTDSAIGKRTTAWMIVDEMRARGISTELIGTGQTAWLQGAKYSVVMDSIINDFVAGELEHAVMRAWTEARPDVMLMEGQGSLLNPAYPGGFELLAATRPHAVIVQHAPNRVVYDGFADFPMDPLDKQIAAIELISNKPVVAITVNTEGIADDRVSKVCEQIEQQTKLPTVAPLQQGVGRLTDTLLAWQQQNRQ